jgi:hypothetical protein
MVRVLKDSFKNALSNDRKKTENVLRSLSSFLDKHYIFGHKYLYVD